MLDEHAYDATVTRQAALVPLVFLRFSLVVGSSGSFGVQDNMFCALNGFAGDVLECIGMPHCGGRSSDRLLGGSGAFSNQRSSAFIGKGRHPGPDEVST
jgi:hypothetical protein